MRINCTLYIGQLPYGERVFIINFHLLLYPSLGLTLHPSTYYRAKAQKLYKCSANAVLFALPSGQQTDTEREQMGRVDAACWWADTLEAQ